jgi:methyltransferase
MITSILVLGLVTAQRLGELALSRHNTRLLLASGATEVAPGHYPLMVMVHAAWLAGLWWYAVAAPAAPTVNPWLIAAYGLLQPLRLWVIGTLGSRWTTRIIHLPGAPLVDRGPYRLMRHPNYAVVVGEIALLPLAFGLAWYAAAFSILNAVVLTIRTRAEDDALRPN